MNTEQERAAFEWWASDEGEYPRAVERAGECYKLAQIQSYWMAWMARAALQSQEYTAAIGGAGQAYLDRFKNSHALPAEFRWSELWEVMCVAANMSQPGPLQSQDRDGARLDWLQQSDGRFFKLLHITSIVGRGFSPTNSSDKWFSSLREAIDHARRIEGEQ